MTQNEISNKTPLWDNYYKYYTPTPLGVIMYGSHRKVLGRVLSALFKDKSVSILDVGCGKGSTLSSIREWGFTNSIGIDLSEVGLLSCEKIGLRIGKDVFRVDATKTEYADKSFDIVFSEGMLEHYTNFLPFADEMSRIAKDYIILVQPNHDCLYSQIIQIGWRLFRRNSGGVEELDHHLYEYDSAFSERGFKLVDCQFTPLKENAVLVFKRM